MWKRDKQEGQTTIEFKFGSQSPEDCWKQSKMIIIEKITSEQSTGPDNRVFIKKKHNSVTGIHQTNLYCPKGMHGDR